MFSLCELSSYLCILLVYLDQEAAVLSEETLHKRAWKEWSSRQLHVQS